MWDYNGKMWQVDMLNYKRFISLAGIFCLLCPTFMQASSSFKHHLTHHSIKHAATHHTKSHEEPTATASVDTNDLKDFQNEPAQVQDLIQHALDLSKQKLAYRFGSDNPKTGGMDCSGTMSFLLKNLGVTQTPRAADDFYKWVWQKGQFFAVNGHHFSSFEFSHLQPGDLLFWTDTYHVDRDPPITHVMLYLGQDKSGNALMFGASQGYGTANQHLRGVSVFNFQLPKINGTSHARFIGYGTIPGIDYTNMDSST